MKNTMKKILAVALVLLMTVPAMAIAAGAEVGYFTTYELAENGDLLYEVDFRGTSGVYNPVDGRSNDWYSVNPQVSQDGSSVTVEYTTTAVGGTDKTPEELGTKGGRARFCSELMDDFSVKGKSYTVEFTIDSTVYVGVHFDGNTGFIINPSKNATTVGQAYYPTKLGGEEIYDGTNAAKQTYAIEISVSDEITDNEAGAPACIPTVYRLFVKDETADNWRLVREIDLVQANAFEWEYYDNADPSKVEDYAYFYLSINRYAKAENNFDTNGDPITSTVSDMKIYKGIDFITKGEDAIIDATEEDVSGGENNGEDAGENNGENGGENTQNKPNADELKPPVLVEDNKDTEAAPAPETEAAKGGCGSSIGLCGAAMVMASAIGVVGLTSRRRKDD